MNTSPEHELYRAILDVLRDFPGLGLVSILTDPRYGIEVRISNGIRGASRMFPFASWADRPPEIIQEGVHHLIGNLVESIQPQAPGPRAAWSSSERFPT